MPSLVPASSGRRSCPLARMTRLEVSSWASRNDCTPPPRRLGIAVPLGRQIDHVADVAIALAIELHGGEHLGQELPGAADEGFALLVLFLARSLADDHETRARVARAETTVGGSWRACSAGTPGGRRSCARARAGISRRGHLARDLRQAEIAVVAERVGGGGQGLAQREPGISIAVSARAEPRRVFGVERSARTRSRMACATSELAHARQLEVPPSGQQEDLVCPRRRSDALPADVVDESRRSTPWRGACRRRAWHRHSSRRRSDEEGAALSLGELLEDVRVATRLSVSPSSLPPT